MGLIELLRRLDEGATEGPWEKSGGHHDYPYVRRSGSIYQLAQVERVIDARLIATLRTLLPAILRELEAGRAIADCPDAVEQDAYCYDFCEVSAGLMDAYRAARAAADEEARKCDEPD